MSWEDSEALDAVDREYLRKLHKAGHYRTHATRRFVRSYGPWRHEAFEILKHKPPDQSYRARRAQAKAATLRSSSPAGGNRSIALSQNIWSLPVIAPVSSRVSGNRSIALTQNI